MFRKLLVPSVVTLVLSIQACSSAERVVEENTADTGPSFQQPDDASTSETSKPEEIIDENSACASASAGTSKDPVFLEFVLDGSGSMSSDDKWVSATSALVDVFTEIEKLKDTNIGVGLIVYSDDKDCTDGSGPYPGFPKGNQDCLADVYPGYVDLSQLTALKNRMLKSDSGGGTPTMEALDGAYARVLRAFKPLPPLPADAKRVAVLISDGVPNGPTADILKRAAKELAATPSIKTFSVGVGEFDTADTYGYDPDFMGDLAVAGGTRATPQCDPHADKIADVCHFQIDPTVSKGVQLKQDFVKAINRIRGLAVGCEYKIDSAGVGSFNPNKINVIWKDGSGKDHLIKKNDDNGWSYDDEANPTKVILNGQSCGDATADLESSVRVIIGCDTNN